MPEARELKDSRSNREEDGRLSHVRVFHADVTPDQLASVTFLPVLGEPLPYSNPNPLRPIIAYNISADYESGSNNLTRITVAYSDDPPTWGGHNPADAFFKSWSLSYYRVAQPIPYAIRDQRSFSYINSQTGVRTNVLSYPIMGDSYWESRTKFIRRVRVVNFAGPGNSANWEAVGERNNTLHKIYNKWYLFTVGDIIESARNTWDLSYAWEWDPGTPNVFSNTDPDVRYPFNMQSIVPGVYTGDSFARPPFHEIVTIPASDINGNPTWPTFKPKCSYNAVEFGYVGLPGFTL